MRQPKAPLPGVGDAALKSGNAEQVKRISARILAAADIDQILLDLRHEILGCFDADDLTLFVVDSEKKEIFSKIPHLDTVQEVRPPMKPGQKGEVIWRFTKGGVVDFACLHPGHYDAGMKGQIKVTNK